MCSSTASMKSSGEMSTPRSTTSKPDAAQHHDAEVLADVVQVALDGAHHDLADGLDARRGEDRLDVGHPRLHRARAGEHLRHEDEVLAELDADERHAGDQAVVHDLERGDALVERAAGERVDRRRRRRRSAPRRYPAVGGAASRTASISRSRSSGRSTNSSISSRMKSLATSLSSAMAPRLRSAQAVPLEHGVADRAQVLDRGLERDRALRPDHLDAGVEVLGAPRSRTSAGPFE